MNAYDFKQGQILSTGENMDLALEGKGFFILKNQSQYIYFRRPGHFVQNANGFLTLGNDKARLQGIRLYNDSNPYGEERPISGQVGVLNLSQLVDIQWPYEDLAPPKATSEIQLARNLDSDAYAKGSISVSQAFLHNAKKSTLLVSLKGADGEDLGMRDGDVLTFSVNVNGTDVNQTFQIQDQGTLGELVYSVTTFLRSLAVGSGISTQVAIVESHESATLRGAISIHSNSKAIKNFQITSDRPISSPKVTKAFALPETIPDSVAFMQITTETLRAPAVPQDSLSQLFDASGRSLGLEDGDLISVTGNIGANSITPITPITYGEGLGSSEITLQMLFNLIRDSFKLPTYDGTLEANLSVSVNPAGSQDNIPDGAIILRGQPGVNFGLSKISTHASNAHNASPSPNNFDNNLSMSTMQNAMDARIVESSITIYDELGQAHLLKLRFTPTNRPNSWLWSFQTEGKASIEQGRDGTMWFQDDGSVATFAFNDKSNRLVIRTSQGHNPISIQIKAGGPKDFTGLTLFRSPSSAAITIQNGFAVGRLKQISIDQNGVLSGYFSNGQSRRLFQIPLATFPNNYGLRLIGQNTFQETAQSGMPTVRIGYENTFTEILVGALESL